MHLIVIEVLLNSFFLALTLFIKESERGWTDRSWSQLNYYLNKIV